MAKRGGEGGRAKQTAFKGMEPVDIPELTDAGEAYESAMQERVKRSKEETEAHDALLSVMHKHKRTVYRSPEGLIVTITPGKEKAKIKRDGDDTTDGADD